LTRILVEFVLFDRSVPGSQNRRLIREQLVELILVSIRSSGSLVGEDFFLVGEDRPLVRDDFMLAPCDVSFFELMS